MESAVSKKNFAPMPDHDSTAAASAASPQQGKAIETPMATPIDSDSRISICGAGLAGTLLALRLADEGFNVRLYERYPDPEREAVPSGRSINLALAERGRHALAEAGVLEAVDKITIPMAGRMVHRINGELSFQSYGQRPEEVNYSVHRDQLSRLLLNFARTRPNIELRFHQRLEAVDFEQCIAHFVDDRDGSRNDDAYDVIIGADGAGSALRKAMEQADGIETQADLLDHAYREFTIPPTEIGDFAIEGNALHIWPRGGFMLIALPNADHSFTATLFLAREGETSFAAIEAGLDESADHYAEARLTAWREFMQEHFAEALPLLSQLPQDLETHPIGRLGTIRCPRWHLAGNALILGDAAHAVVPFHGQGMNAAFEDVDVLMQLLESHDHWNELLAEFQQQRRHNTDALADMALENYEEMRQGVRDPNHLAVKELEWALERSFPERFIPRYSMVMFHRIPYAEAMERGRRQRELSLKLLSMKTAEEKMARAQQWIEANLTPVESD
jgi:kynurenine 3-monooxygenase